MPKVFRCAVCDRDLEAPGGVHGTTGACMFCGAMIVPPVIPGGTAGSFADSPTFGATPLPAEPWPMNLPTGRVDPPTILSEVWTYLKRYWATLLGAQLITEVMASAATMAMYFLAMLFIPESVTRVESSPYGTEPPVLFVAVVLLAELMIYPIAFGPLYHADRIVARGDTSIGNVFGWVRQYPSLLAFLVLLALPMAPLALVSYSAMSSIDGNPPLFALVIAVGTALYAFLLVSLGLGVMEIIDRGVGPVTALKASWSFTKGHRWAILGASLLIYLASMAGMFACYIGMFFTMNAIPLGTIIIYRHLRGLEGGADG